MDKEEFRIKLEEINKLVQQQNYKEAINVVDSIDWRRVKNVRTLCVVGEIYAANKRYEDSKEIFLLAYHRAQIGKNILYRLIEVSLKMGDMDDAEEFFEEYKQVASNDNTQYILQYKILRAKKASLNDQILVLEEYKEKEFTERWSYELAKLYYKAGDKEKCLDLCNEMILWFNKGKYVMKAYDLKMRMGALTGEEKEKYEQQFVPKLITPEEARALKENEENEDALDEDEITGEDNKKEVKASTVEKTDITEEVSEKTNIDSIQLNEKDINGVESIQERITKGIRDIFGGKKKEESETEEEDNFFEEDHMQEEMLKTSLDEEVKDVPTLEPENDKITNKKEEIQKKVTEDIGEKSDEKVEKPDFSATIKMPQLNIPASMKKVGFNDIPVMPKINTPDMLLSKGDPDGKEEQSFNLEDTILAAASAQGIEIPDTAPEEVEEEKEEVKKETREETEETKETVKEAIKENKKLPELEEEEFLSEEDLQEAEAEFLNGPVVKQQQEEIPSLEPENIMPEEIPSKKVEILDLEKDEFIANLLKEKEDELPTEETEVKELKTEAQAEVPELKEKKFEIPVEKKKLTQEEELEQFIESMNPKEEINPMEIVPRKKELSEEEKKLFTYFVKIPGMKEQLIDTLYDAQMAAADRTSQTGNIIVMGGRETGKTRLISGLIPAICKELNLEASKVAYVFAEQINGKDIYNIAEKLKGGFLVIENANQLLKETADQLDQIMESDTEGMTVIIEDEKIGMRKLMARFPKFSEKFTSMINIPVFTNDELVNFAKVYTKENGYTINQMGMLALYNQIGINQKEDEPMSIGAVKELIDAAIAKSKGGIRKFKRNMSKKRTDHDGYIVLYEKDFGK